MLFAAALSLVLSGSSARQLVDDAQKAYARGAFAEAASLLAEASKLDPSSRILFNLARAYEKAGDVEHAIVAYEQYLDRRDAELPALKRARAALATLYRLRPAQPPVAPIAPNVPEPPPAVREAAVAVVTEPPPEGVVAVAKPEVVVAKAAPVPSARPVRTAAIISFISAGAVALTGVGLGLWANGTALDARASLDPGRKPQLVEAAQGRALLTDITYFAAAGVGLVALVLLVVDLVSGS